MRYNQPSCRSKMNIHRTEFRTEPYVYSKFRNAVKTGVWSYGFYCSTEGCSVYRYLIKING